MAKLFSENAKESASGTTAAPAHESPSRTIGFVGNCQAELLQQLFARVTAGHPFRSFYHFYDLPEPQHAKAQNDLAACDTLFIQDIKNCDAYPLGAFRADAQLLRFPFLWFAAPWPYDDFNGMRDAAARAQDDPALHTVTYYDGVIGRLRKLVPDPDARLAAYRALDIDGLVKPERMLDFEARRLEAMDARYEITIGKTILERFRSEPVFHTVNRPVADILIMLLRHLLRELAIDLPLPALPELDALAKVQVPIHPKVAEALGMAWATDDRLYHVDGREMGWAAYMRAYIARYS